jgi:hypothetical protein
MHWAFVILLTFMPGSPEHAPDAMQTIRCRNQQCVERVLNAAEHSIRLGRLRVFQGDPGDLGNGATVQRPILDERFS